MKILLVNPNSEFLINDKVFPTLGLLYLSAYLKRHGYKNVEMLDLNGGHSLPESVDADIVGFYSNTPQFPHAVTLAKKIKAINTARDQVYVIGGPHVSAKPEDALENFDFVVVGEGEKAMLDIVKNQESRAVRPVNKTIHCEYLNDMDSFPFPDRTLVDIKDYKYFVNGKLTTTLITSRGCPFKCNFCANNAWGKTLRMRSARNVFEEVSMLKYEHGYESFMFFDDTMTVNKKRMLEICGLLKELNIIYRCFIRSDTVDSVLLSMMKSSGCVEVGIGLESGSQRILNIVNKGETVEENMTAIKLCHELGIRVKGFLIVGLPGEDLSSVKETADFLEKAELDDIDASIYIPYPGSFIYKNRENFDIDFKDDYEHAWYKGRAGSYRSAARTSSLSCEDIVKIRDGLEKRFKKNPSQDNALSAKYK